VISLALPDKGAALIQKDALEFAIVATAH
jgi:hypothetical protein